MSVVVDFHAHFLPQGAVQAHRSEKPWHGTEIKKNAKGLPLLVTGHYQVGLGALEYWEGPEHRLRAMDAAGVDVQAVSLTPPLFRYYLGRDDAVRVTREVNDSLHE